MNAASRAILALALLAAGCAGPDDAVHDDGTWVGTITTEGNVTTVINESGSVWGGMAAVVEELSIGVETGDEPYMFGSLVGVDATDDRIYVADNQVRAISVYDGEGKHLFDIGREGQGPGEFEGIRRMEIDPAGRVVVQDRGSVVGLDVFEEETGRFLGQADVPALSLMGVPPAFLDDRVITAVQDEAGTIMVKRYRLVLPGEKQQ